MWFLNIFCHFVNGMELDLFKGNTFANGDIQCTMENGNNIIWQNENFKNKENILVVSTTGYERLKKILSDTEDILMKYKSSTTYDFYIINEVYKGEKSVDVKYKNYFFTPDSGDSNEVAKIIDCVKNWNVKFDYNIQTDEFAVDLLSFINTELKLPGMQLDDCYKFRDKVKMKQVLSENIRKPKMYTLNDITNDNVTYPVILKPRCFAGSRGVKIIDKKEKLLQNLKGLYFDYTRVSEFNYGEEDIEVEEYIQAPICHIDGIVFNNEIKFCICSQYINTCFEYTTGKILGSKKGSEVQQKKALDFATEVNNSLKLPNGVFHLEAFWKDENFIFLEIGIRPGGAEIVPSIELATGLNLATEHIKCQIGITPDTPCDKYKYFGWVNFPCKLNSDKELHIKSICLENKNLETLKIKNIPTLKERVDVYFTNYAKNLGSFVFASNDENQMNSDMQFIMENYKVIFE